MKFYNIKNLSGLFFSLVLLPLFSLAQSNYRPGYVVSLKGDTLRGFIDYKEWEKNPTKINFKSDLQAKEAEKFSPYNALAFGVNGLEYYEQYKLSISMDHVDAERMSTGLDTSTTVGVVFLKLAAKGKNVNLYEYGDDIKLRFYTRELQSAKPEELIFRTYLDPNNASQSITQPRYQNQLQQIALKYGVSNEKLTKSIEGSEYTEKDIVNVVNRINGSENQANNIQKAAAVRFFLGAGVSEGSLKYAGDTYLALNASSKSSYGPKVDLGIDAFLNPNVGRLILRAELSVTNGSYKVSSNTFPFASQSFSQFVIALTPQLIYNVYNTDALKVYLGAGAAINLPKNSNNVYTYNLSAAESTRSVMQNYPNLVSNYISFSGRLGLVLNKKYELYACYIPSSVVTDHYGSFTGAITSFQLGFNYLFGTR